LEQYALAYPEIRFTVFSEGRQIFATPGDGQLSSVLVAVYGLQVAEQMVPLHGEERSADPDAPIISGYASRPTCYKSTRQHISFFVNRRWVLSRMLTAAVEGAYHSLLLTGRHPLAVVNIQVDPTLLDVNVHPAKTEIRFLKERRVFAAILQAVRQALLEQPTIPRWQPNQQPLQASAVNTPEQDTEVDEVAAIPQDNPWITVTEEETGTKPPLLSRLWQSHVHVVPAQAKPGLSDLLPEESLRDETPCEVLQSEQPLEEPIESQHRLPHLRVIGQLAQSYIVTEGEDGLYLIDQHAAHERILLERMVMALKTRVPLSQLLLTPISLELAPGELEAIEDHRQQLEQIGFTLEILDGKSLQVRAVPSVLAKQVHARSVHELLVALTTPENLGHTETWEERALANVACKAAIKQNYFLTVSEMREMLEQLEQTRAPFSCCHGRPTMVHFSLTALEREFGRR
jgi:DNA mismatch repair protein MutL